MVALTPPQSRWSPSGGGEADRYGDKRNPRSEELPTGQRTQLSKCADGLQEAEENHLGGQPFTYNMFYLRIKILSRPTM